MITTIAICVVGQIVSFDRDSVYPKLTGEPAKVIQFYDTVMVYAWPEPHYTFQIGPMERQRKRVVDDANHHCPIYFMTDTKTRTAIVQTIMLHGYTVRFLIEVHPFGKFWIYYNTLYASILIGIVCIATILWLRRGKRKC